MDSRNYEYQSDFARKHFAQGIAQGYRTMLRNLLEQRFGALPASVEARLEQADADPLDAWGNRVLTAASLDDVFDSDPR
jgi:AcrR family transcriptional regulator